MRLREKVAQNLAMLIQCGLAIVYGSIVFLAMQPDFPDSPKPPLVGGLVAGFFGSWLTMFCYIWLRHGWKAARSMKMDGND